MRRFGLIGYPLTHSFSQKYFTEKFALAGLTDCSYTNFSLKEISALQPILEDTELCGFNITIPYKKEVISFLHEMDEVVSKIGACNCVNIHKGIRKGFNTDVTGFELSLLPFLKKHHSKALLLGNGGASAAVKYVLTKLGISYLSVSRNTSPEGIVYGALDESIMASHPLLINTTPLGMFPKTEECPDIPYQWITPEHHLYDLVYNPAETRFLQKGKAMGASIQNGEKMLVIQAEESWRIWNP